MNIQLNNIYYRQNEEIKEYRDILLETSIGVLKVYVTGLDFAKGIEDLQVMTRLKEMDVLKEKYGELLIKEARITYDNNMYLLVSGKFILAIEYILNSNFDHSIQELRVVEDIFGVNRTEFNDFKELDIVELPGR